MGSSFFEFNIATSGLFAAKAGLQTTYHNISNISTVGYSRQYVQQRAGSPLERYNGVGQVGTGTVVYGIGRVRDEYLDQKYWPQVSTLGEYGQKKNQLQFMETSFNSLSETGLTSNINDFFSTISDLAFTADSLEYRTSVINTADTLVTNLKNHAVNLRDQQIDINDEMYGMVSIINTIGAQISELNEQIYKSEIDGHMANELRDQRTVLIDELSNFVSIETKEYPDGTGRELGTKFMVLINGQEFVNHGDSRQLKCTRRGDMTGTPPQLHPNDPPGLYQITWDNDDTFNMNGLTGELKGLIEVRDGNGNGGYKGIPYYIDKMNEFVRTLAISMNEGTRLDGTVIDGVIGHTDGFDMNGDPGGLLFTGTDAAGNELTTIADYETEIDIFNFKISDAIKEDSSLLAMSDTNDPTQESNNKVILGYLKLKDDSSLFSEGSVNQFANALSSTLGIDTKQANNFTNFYSDVTKSVNNQRLQVSGVSLNEEINNMVKYQHLYQVSSKIMNVINEIYNTTINGLGI